MLPSDALAATNLPSLRAHYGDTSDEQGSVTKKVTFRNVPMYNNRGLPYKM